MLDGFPSFNAGEGKLAFNTATDAPMLVRITAKTIPSNILNTEDLKFNWKKVLNVLPYDFSPSSVLCSLILE